MYASKYWPVFAITVTETMGATVSNDAAVVKAFDWTFALIDRRASVYSTPVPRSRTGNAMVISATRRLRRQSIHGRLRRAGRAGRPIADDVIEQPQRREQRS